MSYLLYGYRPLFLTCFFHFCAPFATVFGTLTARYDDHVASRDAGDSGMVEYMLY